MHAKSLQSCLTLCVPMDHSPPGSSIHGILQARILQWVAMPSSRGSSQPRDWTQVSLCLLHWQAGSLPLAPSGKPNGLYQIELFLRVSQVALVVKNLPANAGDLRDMGSIPGLGRSPGEGHGNPLQYSCLENPMDRGAWQATVHEVTQSQTQPKRLGIHNVYLVYIRSLDCI